MDRKPLSYESLKTVIQYMNPNLRFEIQMHCPTLRVTEKLVPLKIQNLKLDPKNLAISVDGISYKLRRITRYFKPDGTLDRISRPCDYASCIDYDRYGFKVRPADMTPGDLIIEDAGVRNWDAVREQEDNRLNEWERRLIKLGEDRVEKQKLPKTQEEVRGLEYIDWQVKDLQQRMLRYQLRRDNGQPQLTNYLQLTIQRSEEKIEYMEYNRKLGEAMKYLTSKFLGGRSSPISVDYLYVKTVECFRLPQNLKLVIRSLKVQQHAIGILDAFQPILDKKSLPLKTIFMNVVNRFDHQMIKSAAKLVITGRSLESYIVKNAAFANQRVDFPACRPSYHDIFVIDLIEEWRKESRDIGTHYSFRSVPEKEVEETLYNIVKKQPGAKFSKLEETRLVPLPSCVTIPLNEYSEINIYGDKVEKDDYEGFWTLHVKVHPNGHATLLGEEQSPGKQAKASGSTD